MVGAIVALLLLLAFLLLHGPRGNRPAANSTAAGDEAAVDATADANDVATGAQRGPLPPTPMPTALIDPRWLPDDAKIVVHFAPALVPSGELPAGVDACLQDVPRALCQSFGLKPEVVHRLTLVGSDFAKWPQECLALVQLVPGQNATVLEASGEDAGVSVAGKACRRLPQASWKLPYAVIDPRTIVSAPAATLQHLASRAQPALQSEAIKELCHGFSGDAELALMLDLAAAREADWPLPRAACDVWPAATASWHTLWQEPTGLGLSVVRSGHVQADAAWYCRDADSGQRVRGALGAWTTAAGEALPARLAAVDAQLKQGQLTAAAAGEYEMLLKAAAASLRSVRSEQVKNIVWARAVLAEGPDAMTASWQASRERIASDWLSAALSVDRAQQQKIADALGAPLKSEGQFPPGAAGSPMLPPETRLSWIATMLPYLDHVEWSRKLQTSYPWNSAQNQPVTREPLGEVINPALTERSTEAGFPVTHYVGVAGVGADAGNLPRSDPRAGVFGYDQSARQQEIADGASNTIAIAGVRGQLGPWAAGGPRTVRAFTQRPYVNGPDGFGSGQNDGMLVSMADGSVRFISKDVDPSVVEQLATVAGARTANVAALGPAPWQAATEAVAPAVEAADTKPPAVAENAAAAIATEKPPAANVPRITIDLAPRLATPLAGLRLADTPWLHAVRLLAAVGDVPLGFDPSVARESGAALLEPVTIDVEATTVGKELNKLVTSHGLVCVNTDSGVVVTWPVKTRDSIITQRISLDDILLPDAGSGADLVALIQRMVRPESWQANGGRGKLQIDGQSLALEQTPLVIGEVGQFLGALYAARKGAPPHAATATDPAAADAAAAEGGAGAEVATSLSLNYQIPAPLKEVLDRIETQADVTILVDWPALAARGILATTPARVNAVAQPCDDVLRALVQPLGLQCGRLEGATYWVSTPEQVDATLMTRFYRLPAKAPLAPEALAAKLQTEVAPGAWQSSGGAGAMQFDPRSGCLIVLQSLPVQAEIARWLRDQK